MNALPFVIEQNKPLAASTTLGLFSTARYYVRAATKNHLLEAVLFARSQNLEILVLGGGSNVVLAPFLDCLVVAVCTRGIEVDGKTVTVSAEKIGISWLDTPLTWAFPGWKTCH